MFGCTDNDRTLPTPEPMTRTRVTCLDCGTEFARPNGYRGNYCQSCHEAWTDATAEQEGDDADPRGRHPGSTSSTRRIDEEDADSPSRYDEE